MFSFCQLLYDVTFSYKQSNILLSLTSLDKFVNLNHIVLTYSMYCILVKNSPL